MLFDEKEFFLISFATDTMGLFISQNTVIVVQNYSFHLIYLSRFPRLA